MTRVVSSNEFSFYDSDYPCIYASQCGIYDDPLSFCICALIFQRSYHCSTCETLCDIS